MKSILSWVAALSGLALLNTVLFYATLAIDSPTVIAGLGWLLDHPTLGNPLIQLIVFGGSMAGYLKLEQASHETGANTDQRGGWE